MEAPHRPTYVLASDFHPMRGHVAANTRVKFQNGAVLIVKPDRLGWALFDGLGFRISKPALDAQGLTRTIVDLDARATGQ